MKSSEETGQRKRLAVIIPGMTETPYDMSNIAKYLVHNRFDVHTANGTDWTSADSETQAKTIQEKLLSILGKTREQISVLIAGHSYGGLTALELAQLLKQNNIEPEGVITFGTPLQTPGHLKLFNQWTGGFWSTFAPCIRHLSQVAEELPDLGDTRVVHAVSHNDNIIDYNEQLPPKKISTNTRLIRCNLGHFGYNDQPEAWLKNVLEHLQQDLQQPSTLHRESDSNQWTTTKTVFA